MDKGCRKAPGCAPQTGFTLFELLVVLAIIGIMLTAVTFSIGGDRRGDELARESRRFAALLELAGEQAVLRSEEWAVQVEPDRYRFLVLDEDNAWRVVSNDRLFRSRELQDGTRLDLELEGRELVLESADKIKPTLLLLSSGEITPFTAEFSARLTESRFEVTGDLLGEIAWQRGES